MQYLENRIGIPELSTRESKDENGIRWYETDGISYPSVTSVLGKTAEDKNKALEDWRKRVGASEADRTTEIASRRGTRLHGLTEAYVKGLPLPVVTDFATNNRFLQIQGALGARVQEVYNLEVALRSTTLRVAGRSDCIGLFDNELSILDFKTSKHPVERFWIEDYFLQVHAYRNSLMEMISLKKVPSLVIIIASVGSTVPQIFVEDGSTFDKYDLEFTKRRILFDTWLKTHTHSQTKTQIEQNK